MKIKIIIVSAGLWLVLIGTSVCFGYGKDTHEEISRQAFNNSIVAQLIAQGKLQDIGLTDTGTGTTFYEGKTHDGQVHSKTIIDWVAQGGYDEDEPFTRSLNHFYDPITGNGLLIFCPSLNWGLGLCTQIYSYKDAVQYYFDGLTNSSISGRSKSLANAFYSLGHVIHLIQDLAQPQHTRLDMHPPWNSSLYEDWSDNFRKKLPFAGYTPVYPSNSSVFYSVTKFWKAGNGIYGDGLAEFSNHNFVSAGTNFTSNKYVYPLLLPTGSQDISILDICNPLKNSNPGDAWICGNDPIPNNLLNAWSQLNPAPVLGFFSTTVEGPSVPANTINQRASTLSIFDPDLVKLNQKQAFTLNRFNFASAQQFLIPRAVAYSAGLINYFFRGSMDASLDANGNLIIKNTSSEDMVGTFTLYYDDANDVRKDVVSKTGLTIGTNKTGSLGSFSPPTSPAPKEPGKYILVFNGKMGQEQNAVSGRIIHICSNVISDDFNGSSLNSSIWTSPVGSSCVSVGGGVLNVSGYPCYPTDGDPQHKSLMSIQTFTPSNSEVKASARIYINGNYQGFGFSSFSSSFFSSLSPYFSIYFDTYDNISGNK